VVPLTSEVPEVAQASTVDLSAFAAAYETHRVPALRLAYAMTGDAAVAEDVVAEAFARTYERWAKGKVDNPAAYVRQAVVNEVRSTFRRIAVRRKHTARERRGEPSTTFPGDRLADSEVLRQALTALTPRQRAVVVLRVVEDMSERDVAKALGCSEGTVKSHLSRGLAALRDALAQSEGGSDA
jgi:RNA polymerase sigma-70 factor (sigma-E family)